MPTLRDGQPLPAPLPSLLARMGGVVPPGEVVKIGHTVAFDAYREAETLRDGNLVQPLVNLLKVEPDRQRRVHAEFILYQLGSQGHSAEVVPALLAHLPRERDWHLRSYILDHLAKLDQPVDADVQPILDALKDRWPQVRNAAMAALGGSPSAKAEPALLEIIRRSSDPYELMYSQGSLARIGSPKAIPFLETHAASRKRDVRSTAQGAIDAIRRRHGILGPLPPGTKPSSSRSKGAS